jgi:hypothetical protein
MRHEDASKMIQQNPLSDEDDASDSEGLQLPAAGRPLESKRPRRRSSSSSLLRDAVVVDDDDDDEMARQYLSRARSLASRFKKFRWIHGALPPGRFSKATLME